jgi:ribose transport system ATP-binding protein
MNKNIFHPHPLLEMKNITKTFPGVRALDKEGEVLALLGENGAGKSTLIKVLGGAHSVDSGDIFIDNRLTKFNSPAQAWEMGISIIYQEFNLIPELTIRDNIFLGKEKTRKGIIDYNFEKRKARSLFDKIGLKLDTEVLCSSLTVAQQQMVEIAKALSVNAKIIVMDEPSATLSTNEVEKLFSIIRDLKKQNISIIYISHRLDEIFEVADRVMVLRDGINVGEEDPKYSSRDGLIEKMVGRTLKSEFPKNNIIPGKERLRVENMSAGTKVCNVSFNLREKEIVGFAGLVGAGRTELMHLIFGIDKPDSGRIFLNGVEIKISNPRDAIRNRICLLPEDRKKHGLVLNHSCRENFGLPNLKKYIRFLFLDTKKEENAFDSYVNDLKIKISDYKSMVSSLSGGNQQKIVLAKWLETNSDIIIFDEPTRGIDVGAKYEIYLLINKLANEGKSIIIVSSELPELLGICNRIIVMHEGYYKGEVNEISTITQEDILKIAIS